MTWQWVPLCWCASWLGMSIVHANALITPWWCHPPSGSGTWVESSGIRVGSAHLGEEDAWDVSVNVGKRLVDACGLVRPCSTSEFCVVFTVVLVSSSSTWWYSQNTILTTFIFKQKSKTTLNQMLWYQLLRNPTGDVLIVVYWRLSTLTQYLTWFGKPPASMEEVHIIRDRERIQYKYMKEEDHIHSNSTPSSHCCPCSSSLFLSYSLHILCNSL
jgi:hypothetical protein